MFTRSSGLIVLLADSFLYADRGMHFLFAHDIHLKAWNIGLAYPPRYPLVVCLAYLASDPATAHVWMLHSSSWCFCSSARG